MKKVLSLAACSALVLGFATAASAAHVEAPAETSAVVAKGGLITMDGSLRMRGFSLTRALQTNADGTMAGYDTRARLGFKVQTSDAVSGYLRLENGRATGDTEAWGLGTNIASPGAAALFNGGEKMNGLEILEAWINYKPGDWGVKVGHMPLALGNKLFFDHTGSGDDAIVAYTQMGNTHIAGLVIKFAEGLNPAGVAGATHTDEIDGYVGLVTHKVSDSLSLGANWTNLHIGQAVTQATSGVANNSASFNNIGITVDGKMAGFTYGLDAEFQFGDMITDINGDGQLDDAGGYALMGKIGMDMSGWKLGALIGYGSGDDNGNDNDADQFVNFLTDTRYQSTMVGYRQAIPTLGAGGANLSAAVGGNGRNTGLSNMLLFQLSAATSTTCPLTGKPLALKMRANYMKLNEEAAATAAAGNPNDDLGFELELFATWKLGGGLVYGVEAAYLWAGEAWANNATAYNNEEDGFFLRHRLELKF